MPNRPLLILTLLEQLHTVHPHGMRAADLHRGATLMGHPKVTLAEVESLLADMEGSGLATSKPDALDGAVTLYARTEAGRVQLAKNGRI